MEDDNTRSERLAVDNKRIVRVRDGPVSAKLTVEYIGGHERRKIRTPWTLSHCKQPPLEAWLTQNSVDSGDDAAVHQGEPVASSSVSRPTSSPPGRTQEDVCLRGCKGRHKDQVHGLGSYRTRNR